MKQAQILDATCVVCREGITNPICPECLAKEMKNWQDKIREKLPTVSFEGDVKCLFCGKKMGVCAHCYCKDVYDSIVSDDPELAEEFLDIFDYGLREEFL